MTIAAVGKARRAPETEWFDQYVKRLPWPVTLQEVQAKSSLPPDRRQQEEGRLLLSHTEKAERIVVLDERGRMMPSLKFAKLLGQWRDDGVSEVAFLIGGADGHTEEVRQAAHEVLSLSLMTWPHLLVRVLLAEQLYRAYSILSGHPYHRE